MRWLFVTVLFVLSLVSSNSLECYTCSGHIGNSNSLNDCERFNYYDNHRKSVCMPGDQVCAKYIVNHDGMNWVHRSCRPYDVCNHLRSMYSNGRDQLLECSTCSDQNLCNSGTFYASSLVVLFSVIIVKIFLDLL